MAEIFVAKEEDNLIIPIGVKSYPMQGKRFATKVMSLLPQSFARTWKHIISLQ